MNESKATRYQRLRRRASMVGSCLAVGTLSTLALTPAGRWLRDWAWQFASGLAPFPATVVALGVFLVFVLLSWEVAALPAVLYLAVAVDRTYGRTESNVENAFLSQLQATALALPAVLVSGAVVTASVRVAGRWWWSLAGVALSAALMAVIHGGPRLFSRLAAAHPVSQPALAERLRRLAARVRVPVAGIDEWMVRDSSVTALVTGIGRARRVLISADVIRHWSEDEIEVVVAHELAHHAHHDLWRTLAVDAAVLSLGLWVADIAVTRIGPLIGLMGREDLAALPLMALAACGIWGLATPVRHAQSRRHERQADVSALSWTGQADAFSSAVRRLSVKHLAEERPSTLIRWFYHRHPPVADRLALADRHRDRTVAERRT
jgi:STE24 endopeptidase